LALLGILAKGNGNPTAGNSNDDLMLPMGTKIQYECDKRDGSADNISQQERHTDMEHAIRPTSAAGPTKAVS
jgi:hypothetical protein